MTTKAGTLLDILKKKLTQAKEEAEKYQEEAEENRKKLQTEIRRREETESEVAASNRRIKLLEEELERSEHHLVIANTKLAEVSHSVDEFERMRQAFENRSNTEDDRVAILEAQLVQAKQTADEAGREYEEVARKLVMLGADLERTEKRAVQGEAKIVGLEEELRVAANRLQSLKVVEDKAGVQEDMYEMQIKNLSTQLKEVEARAETAERSAQKLKKEVFQLEDELVAQKKKNQELQEEIEKTLQDIQEM